jgi:hypothetical protein
MPINVVQNVFCPETLEKLHAFSRGGKQPSRTNFFSYEPHAVGMSNAIFCFDLDDDIRTIVFDELVSKNVLPSTPVKAQSYIHLFSRNSFIPWHDDRKYAYTVTIYLNQDWDLNFGGLFVYQDGEDLKCIPPKYNSAAYFAPPIPHTTTATAINAPLRESLQIFVEEF